MPEHILVIEDDGLVRDLVALNLGHAGYAVHEAADYPSGLAALLRPSVDLALVDVMLPGGDGFSLTRSAREHGCTYPIFMLTARDDTSSKVRGLDSGADDYVLKPFDVHELLARVRAALRRSSPSGRRQPPLSLGPYWVRLDSGWASTSQGELTLSERELELLQVLVRRPGEVLTRAELAEAAWRDPGAPGVDEVLARLQQLLEVDAQNPRHLLGQRGRGTSFVP